MIIHNIIPDHFSKLSDEVVTIRGADPAELVEFCLVHPDMKIWSLQILDLKTDSRALEKIDQPIKLDLVIETKEFQLLYNYVDHSQRFPIRATIPLEHGCEKAVKLAASLHFPIKLDIGQPEPDMVAELQRIAEFYLHNSTTSQPIEFIHSVFLSFLYSEPISLWSIQEEDPEQYVYITEADAAALSMGLRSRVPVTAELMDLISGAERPLNVYTECRSCPYFKSPCRSYFKYPNSAYDCEEIKQFFSYLLNSSVELKKLSEKAQRGPVDAR